MGWQKSNYCALGGFLLSLSLFRRGFQDLLDVMWVHFKFNGSPDESIHVSGFGREEFILHTPTACEDGTDKVLRNVGI
jgi:hypothetical protein